MALQTMNPTPISVTSFLLLLQVGIVLPKGNRRCFNDQTARCKVLKNEVTDFICLEKGYIPIDGDCSKFYRCLEIDAQPCLCRCRHRNLVFDSNGQKCVQTKDANSCSSNRKLKEIKADAKDFLESLKKENAIIKSMSEEIKEQDNLEVHSGTTVPPLELHTGNLTASNIIIRDDFPVWAISLAVSGAVTIAVGVILFFY